MPELPEVETIRRDLAKAITGLKIKSIVVRDRRVIRMPQQEFVSRVQGRMIKAIGRRGKAIQIDLDGQWLVVQPMMTGQLVVVPPGKKVEPAKETKVIFQLSKGYRLFYNDQRLFGRVSVVQSLDEIAYFRVIGPEPLEKSFTSDVLVKALKGRTTPIKTLLLDHRVVAGIGNIYASEALFLAGIRPTKKVSRLTFSDIVRLHRAIVDVLKLAVRMRGTSLRNYRDGQGKEGKYLKIIQVYGRDGQPCRKCGAVIKKIVQAQRSTYYCLTCQK